MAKKKAPKKAPKKRSGASNGKAAKKKRAAKPTPQEDKSAFLVGKNMPLRRHVSPDVKTVFANHVVVRGDLNLFQLFFFNAEPPLVVDGDSEDVKKAAEAMTHVDAHCVSRVIIPPQVMPALIKALQTNFETRESAVAAIVKADSAKGKKK